MFGVFPNLPNDHGILFFAFDRLPESPQEAVVHFVGYVQPPTVHIEFPDPIPSHFAEVFPQGGAGRVGFRHVRHIGKAGIGGRFAVYGQDQGIGQVVKPIVIGRRFAVLQHVLKRKVMPAHVIEHAVHDHADAFFVCCPHQHLEIRVCSKTGIDVLIIHHIVLMVSACGKDGIQIEAVETHLPDIIQVLPDAMQGAAVCGNGGKAVIDFAFPIFADLSVSVRKAVREDVVHHRILHPFGNGGQIGFVIEGVLEILAALDVRVHLFKAFPGIAALRFSVVQQEIISDPLPFRFQRDFVPVIEQVGAD